MNSKKLLTCLLMVMVVLTVYLGVELCQTKQDLVTLENSYNTMIATVPPAPSWPEGIIKETVIDELAKRKDLFPWQGVLGGTFGLYDKSQVWFVGPKWCLAYVEDGHIGGYILLRYHITPKGIEWQLLDSEDI
nr:hypothetical protein [Acetomicrobium sp. UBA5826]